MARKGPITPPDASHRVVILHGKEAFLRAEYTNQLAEKLEAEHGAVDRVRFDDSAQASDILDECRSFGLMAPHKLVIVDDADKLLSESTRPLFERYAEAPPESATLVLRAQTWRPGRLDKAVAKVGVVTPCEEASESVAARWAGRRAPKAHGAELAPEAAAALIARVGTDLARLDSELAKLAAAIEDSGTITPALVAELVGMTREEEVWSIQAELLSGDPERTLAHLRAILEHAPRDAHVPVTFACTDLARKIHAASHAVRQGQNPGQVAKALRLWGPARDAVLHAARKVEPDRARDLLEACVDADRAGKSGLGRPERTLERLALRFSRLAR